MLTVRLDVDLRILKDVFTELSSLYPHCRRQMSTVPAGMLSDTFLYVNEEDKVKFRMSKFLSFVNDRSFSKSHASLSTTKRVFSSFLC